MPRLHDRVIGIVTDRFGEGYRLSIGGPFPASLGVLAFDGASRRNRPQLAVGAVVYARVAVASRDVDPEVTCMSPEGSGRKDWVTGESEFGELKGGTIVDCSPHLAARFVYESSAATVVCCLRARRLYVLASMSH